VREPRARILLVEDNYMNRVLIKEILTLSGYETVEAENGAEAIRKIAESDPDLVLMDLRLPGMDGVTATRIIKANDRFKLTPVLALTASASKGDEEDMLNMGFDGCVTKPVDRKRLIDTISESLKKRGG